MKEFIDKIEGVEEGTDINRANLMAAQGFIDSQISISFVDGKKVITKTNGDGHTLTTTYNNDGTISQSFQGDKTIAKGITISNGNIYEEVL